MTYYYLNVDVAMEIEAEDAEDARDQAEWFLVNATSTHPRVHAAVVSAWLFGPEAGDPPEEEEATDA